jgi:hypothetical protein
MIAGEPSIGRVQPGASHGFEAGRRIASFAFVRLAAEHTSEHVECVGRSIGIEPPHSMHRFCARLVVARKQSREQNRCVAGRTVDMLHPCRSHGRATTTRAACAQAYDAYFRFDETSLPHPHRQG